MINIFECHNFTVKERFYFFMSSQKGESDIAFDMKNEKHPKSKDTNTNELTYVIGLIEMRTV